LFAKQWKNKVNKLSDKFYNPQEVTVDSNTYLTELVFDSLDAWVLVSDCEEHFHVKFNRDFKSLVNTVDELVNLLYNSIIEEKYDYS
jgi:acyl carrier protein